MVEPNIRTKIKDDKVDDEMKLVLSVDLSIVFGDRIEQVQENVERELLLDEGFRNEVLHILKRKLENGSFRVED